MERTSANTPMFRVICLCHSSGHIYQQRSVVCRDHRVKENKRIAKKDFKKTMPKEYVDGLSQVVSIGPFESAVDLMDRMRQFYVLTGHKSDEIDDLLGELVDLIQVQCEIQGPEVVSTMFLGDMNLVAL